MTHLLQTAFDRLKKLPENEQNAFAQRILEELSSESKWAALFTATSDEQWDALVAEVDKEIDTGRHESLGDAFRTPYGGPQKKAVSFPEGTAIPEAVHGLQGYARKDASRDFQVLNGVASRERSMDSGSSPGETQAGSLAFRDGNASPKRSMDSGSMPEETPAGDNLYVLANPQVTVIDPHSDGVCHKISTGRSPRGSGQAQHPSWHHSPSGNTARTKKGTPQKEHASKRTGSGGGPFLHLVTLGYAGLRKDLNIQGLRERNVDQILRPDPCGYAWPAESSSKHLRLMADYLLDSNCHRERM